jgi:fructose-bisphosphate aldolase class II
MRVTRELCAQAHGRGIWFEAELGYVPKPGSARPNEHIGELTDPADVAPFVAATGIDALAIAIGSHHGQQRKETRLDLARLAAIRATTDLPLVLHGSSGVTDDSLKAGIQQGLCKINIATQLNIAFTAAVRQHLADHADLADPRPYLSAGRAAVVARVQERMRILGCAGKADHR